MKIKIVANQTLRDVAIKYYGNIEAMSEIIENNPQLKNSLKGNSEKVLKQRSDLNKDDFLLDKPLLVGLEIEIDKASFLEFQDITRELKNYEINTFDNGEEN